MTATHTWDKVDPRDDQMLTLATMLKDATSKSDNSGGGSDGGGSDNPGGEGQRKSGFSYEDWQLVKKGDSIVQNGITWWWCPKHNKNKGLYVCYPRGDHDK